MRTPVLASDGDEAGTMLTTSIYNVDDEVRRQFGGVATIDHAVQSDDRKSRFAAAARRHYHSMTSLDGSDDVIATARDVRRFQNVILATFQSSKKVLFIIRIRYYNCVAQDVLHDRFATLLCLSNTRLKTSSAALIKL